VNNLVDLDTNFFDKKNCIVCGSTKSKIKYKNIFHTCNVLKKSNIPYTNEETPSDVMECNQCGHKYLSYNINDKTLNYYYSVAESEYYDSMKINPRDRLILENKERAKSISKKFPNSKTVLEIGCGMGYFLKNLSENGYECVGVEPSSFASNYAREEFGLNVITGLLDKDTFDTNKFDIIVIFDVVEHINNIDNLFDLVTHYLAKDGSVIILTGNSNSLYARICKGKWLYYYSWEHVSFFNRKSTKYLFDKHNLELTEFSRTSNDMSLKSNTIIFVKTIVQIIKNFFGIEKSKFYSMAFDHFLAVGKNRH
jgi:2-polyprenyl-3-methyl-5-hydroxy-6-metoxy-1,4-benzoquinol methylase